MGERGSQCRGDFTPMTCFPAPHGPGCAFAAGRVLPTRRVGEAVIRLERRAERASFTESSENSATAWCQGTPIISSGLNICRCCFLLARECFSVLRGALFVSWSLCVSLSRSVARTWARGCGGRWWNGKPFPSTLAFGESAARFSFGGRRCLDISVFPGMIHLIGFHTAS
jgi:hypothetical protein